MKRQYFMFFMRKMWFYLEIAIVKENDIIYWKLYNFNYTLVNKKFTFGIEQYQDNIDDLIQEKIYEDSDDPENEIEALIELSKEEFDFLITK